jgi:starch phosphorylase
VADGWAAELDWESLGWELNADQVAKSFYETLESGIKPVFFDRDAQGVPQSWVQLMQASIKKSDQFSAKRMLTEYLEKLYS